jgi:hypothetical protein
MTEHTPEPVTGQRQPEADSRTWVLANEFAEVHLSLVRTHNGARLRIRDPKGGRSVDLCPVELESLTWQTPEVFSGFLATPFGPEEGG